MSSDFTKILVKDDRMDCVDNIKYAVIKGGQNVTPSQFKAISQSNNQLVFNIQVPSEQTLIDRRVLLSTDLQLVVTSYETSWTAAGLLVPTQPIRTVANVGCGYGNVAGLGAYPLHSMMTVASATVNNNTVSVNMKDVLPAIIRMLDKKELGAYNGMSATATDSLLNYSDQVLGASPSLGSAEILDTDYVGRGTVMLKDYSLVNTPAAGLVPAFTTETFTWHISEALMLSPFIYSNPKSNGQAFYGVQNMNFVLNIGSDLNRVFRGCGPVNGLSADGTAILAGSMYASPAGQAIPGAGGTIVRQSLPVVTSVAPGNFNATQCMFDNTYLFFTFLTAHPSDLFPARNIVPYYELPRYITTATAAAPLFPTVVNAVAAGDQATQGNAYISNFSLLSGEVLVSQTLQLNQIPDKLICYIRKQRQLWNDSDSYLPITRISIDFNNNSGLLSAARCEDLYRMSKDNGSNQNWMEWIGYQQAAVTPESYAYNNPAAANAVTLVPNCNIPIPSQQWTQGTFIRPVATVGGVLVLEFGKDIQLIEDFFAPGSLGNFNIRLNITYQNNNLSVTPLGAADPVTFKTNTAVGASNAIELVMITMNSGVFVCERGTSSTYTGILTRADVLEASEQDAYTRSDIHRLVGGGFLDMLKSGVSKLAPLAKAIAPMVMPHAKAFLEKQGTLGRAANGALGALGYGQSGGGSSGGRLHGRYN